MGATTRRWWLPGLMIGLLLAGCGGSQDASTPAGQTGGAATPATEAIPGKVKVQQIDGAEVLKLEEPYSGAMKLVRGPDDAIWVVTKYDVFRHPEGDPARGEKVLDPQRYEQLFGRKMTALSTAFATPDGVLWTGDWNGEILRFHRGQWRVVVEAGLGQVASLVLNDAADVMWIGSNNGLWRFVKKGNRFEELDGQGVDALALDDAGQLVVGTWEGAFTWTDGGSETLWNGDDEESSVTALRGHDGGWWIGTRTGLVDVDLVGRELGRHLEGRQIMAIASEPGRRLAGTWESGLWFEENGDWHQLAYTHGLAGDAVYDLLAMPDGRLWFSIYGEGTFIAELSSLRRLAAEAPPATGVDGVRVFEDACAAVGELSISGQDGQIAVEEDSGGSQVFFHRELVCPKPSGTWRLGDRRGPGDFLVLETSSLKRVRQGTEKPLALPRGIEPSDVLALFVKEVDRLYVGTRSQGLFVTEGGFWKRAGGQGLVDNAITVLAEDADGVLWVGSSPAATEGIPKVGLSAHDGTEWRRFRTDRGSQGPVYGDTQSLAALSGGRLAVGTNGGLSIWDGETFMNYEKVLGRDTPFNLPHQFIVSIAEDGAGRLFMAHAGWGEGITIMGSRSLRAVSSRDGLFENRIVNIAFDGRGRAWLRAIDGRVAVYPADAWREPEP